MADVIEIINAINNGGRQGPQSILSHECYQWVRERLDISYEEYERVVLENTARKHERATARDWAYFIWGSGDKVVLFKSNEAELRPYVCLAVTRTAPPVTSSRLIAATKAIYPHFTLADKLWQNRLNSPQIRIDQVIRNILVSNYKRRPNNRLFDRRSGAFAYEYSLTEAGRELAMHALEEMSGLRQAEATGDGDTGRLDSLTPVYGGEELREMHLRPVTPGRQTSNRVRTDRRLLRTVMERSNYRCAVDEGHMTFESAVTGENYVEGHHLIPLAAQPSVDGINLDCPENLVMLCPNCHSAVHYGSIEVRRRILAHLADRCAAGLKRIGIDRETLDLLIWRFYLC